VAIQMSDTSIQSSTPVNEHKGYNRGLILGLTMAESMLLLVFCLLLITGAIILKEKEKTRIAEAALKTANAELISLTDERDSLLKISVNNKTSDDVWRKLVVAKQQIEKLESLHLIPEDLAKNAEAIRTTIDKKLTSEDLSDIEKMKETKQLLANFNMSPEHLKELLPAIDLLTKILSDETPYEDQIMNLIADAEKGKAAGEGKPHEWPPIISLSETQDHYFKSGSAEISPAFRELLIAKTANQIATIAAQYGVNVVEVIGHTDEQRITGIRSNLDSEIADVLNGNKSIAALKPGDNAGLGLARALAVTQVLRGQPRLTGLTILPMSGAQLTLPSDDLTDGRDAGNSEGRRRIEIRVRKRNEIMSDATPTRLETPDVN
jgi:flagellar motor protein MotB